MTKTLAEVFWQNAESYRTNFTTITQRSLYGGRTPSGNVSLDTVERIASDLRVSPYDLLNATNGLSLEYAYQLVETHSGLSRTDIENLRELDDIVSTYIEDKEKRLWN